MRTLVAGKRALADDALIFELLHVEGLVLDPPPGAPRRPVAPLAAGTRALDDPAFWKCALRTAPRARCVDAATGAADWLPLAAAGDEAVDLARGRARARAWLDAAQWRNALAAGDAVARAEIGRRSPLRVAANETSRSAGSCEAGELLAVDAAEGEWRRVSPRWTWYDDYGRAPLWVRGATAVPNPPAAEPAAEMARLEDAQRAFEARARVR